MYFSVYDSDQTTLVSITSGKLSDEEWQEFYEDIMRLVDECKRAGKEFILVAIAGPDTERPNASWRRKLAEIRHHSNDAVHRSLTALVTSSLLLRGVITALNWIVPKRSKDKIMSVNSFEEAHKWLSKETQRPLAYLPDMYKAVIQKMNAQSLARL
jgi:hypothetical protein